MKDLLKRAIETMLCTDAASDPARPLLETSERNITAHLRNYIALICEAETGEKYQVDHEYNRVGSEGDKPKFSSILNHNVIPDILIHFRGVRRSENPKANLLVVEAKKIPLFQGDVSALTHTEARKQLEDDLRKLEALKNSTDQYGYLHIASIVFADGGVWIKLNEETFELLIPT